MPRATPRRFYTPTQAEALELEFGVDGVAGVLLGAAANRLFADGWGLVGVWGGGKPEGVLVLVEDGVALALRPRKLRFGGGNRL